MSEHQEIVELLEALIDAVSTDYWASVLLLVVLLIVLLGGLALMYFRVKANEKMMLILISKLNGRHPVSDEENKDGD